MGWISVKERLPDCWSQHRNHYGSGYLLGYTKYNEIEITQLWKVYIDGVVIYEWEGQDDEDDYITHWMPMMKPPLKD